MTTPPSPTIATLKDLKAALQLAVGLELSTVPVYLTALYSIKEGANEDAQQTIRSVVMEEMLHMTLAANVLNALGEHPSVKPVDFLSHRNVKPVPEYKDTYESPVIAGIGKLALLPLSPAAVEGFVRIEHPLHGAAQVGDIVCPTDTFPTIGTFYEAINAALKSRAICPDSAFRSDSPQVRDREYYGGAGQVITVTNRDTAMAAIEKIVDEGEGLPEKRLNEPAKELPVTTKDVLNSGWKMYSHYARFRELQTGRRFRTGQLARETPAGSLLLVDYDAVHPAVHVQRNGSTTGGYEGAALNEFDLAYTQLVDDLYLAFSGGKKKVTYTMAGKVVTDLKDPLPLAVHGMYALKNKAVALMRTPKPGDPGHTLCPRFFYADAEQRTKLKDEIKQMRGAVQ
ncbi:ferritin-like protein [Streptomyces sp. NPDC051677]|uniref:ferritin-like protein n=1 Tax=Streptomyces sp. NPDC051677 TaxID=3365669 RepID=UPI0037D4804E